MSDSGDSHDSEPVDVTNAIPHSPHSPHTTQVTDKLHFYKFDLPLDAPTMVKYAGVLTFVGFFLGTGWGTGMRLIHYLL
jgi:hypothetical protein